MTSINLQLFPKLLAAITAASVDSVMVSAFTQTFNEPPPNSRKVLSFADSPEIQGVFVLLHTLSAQAEKLRLSAEIATHVFEDYHDSKKRGANIEHDDEVCDDMKRRVETLKRSPVLRQRRSTT